MRFRIWLLLGLIALPCWSLAEDDSKPAADPGDVQDVIFLGDARPVLIRLHISINGKPLMASWEEFIRDVFRYCDVDGDGSLSREELQHVIPPQSLLNGGIRFGGGLPLARVTPLRPDKDGKVSFEAFKEYYARSGASPFEVQLASGGSDGLTKALFEHLDTNKDGKLSRAELAAAEKVLMKLDTDDDEILTAQELGPNPYLVNSPFQPIRPPGIDNRPLDDNAAFFVVGPGERPERLVAALQRRYGKGEHQSFTQAGSRLDPAIFELLDKNKDGRLDANELAEFCHRSADIEISLQIPAENKGEGQFELLHRRDGVSKEGREKRNSLGFELGNANLQLTAQQPGGVIARSALKLKDLYLQQFKAADTDNNGYLDMQEAQANPFFQQSFKLIDRDGDGKIFEKELIAYIDSIEGLQQKAAACRASLTITEGQGLFELLDRNHDGKLTIRELRAAPQLLDQLDKDGDGYLALEKIPRHYQLAFGRGQVNPAFRQVAFKFGGPIGPEAPPARLAGPVWFRKMDKNRDGDVSRREFLGTKEEFDRIDADGDGLISLEEAERYDALKRKTADVKK